MMFRSSRPARLAALLAAGVLVAGCSAQPAAPGGTAPSTTPSAVPPASSTAAPGDAAALLAKYNLSGKTAEQVVEAMDQDPAKRPLALRASVRSNEVLLNDGTTEATLPLTTDKFYLSIAPYKTQTHECYFHNLGTCQGELVGKDVQVTITDNTGTVLVDEAATTYANGFVAFWIPKNTVGTITVTADGLTGETPFDSSAGGATCVTTLQLQ